MEEEQRAFKTFLLLNESKAGPTQEPTAYLQFFNRETGNPVEQSLIAFTKEDVLEEMDSSSELVRFLLHQMSTYDCTCQRIVGLIFDKRTVLSDVLRMP